MRCMGTSTVTVKTASPLDPMRCMGTSTVIVETDFINHRIPDKQLIEPIPKSQHDLLQFNHFGNSRLWQQLQSAADDTSFFASWMILQCSQVDGVVRAFLFAQADSGSFVPVTSLPEGCIPEKQVLALVERAGHEQKGIVLKPAPSAKRTSTTETALYLAYPVDDGGTVRLVVILQLTDRSATATQTAMRQLQWGTSWLAHHLQAEGQKAGEGSQDQMQSVLELIALTLEQENSTAAALAVVTELAERLGCHRVAIGFAEKKQVRLVALSHSSQFGRQMNLSRALEGLMDESVDQSQLLLYPQDSPDDHVILHAHAMYTRKYGMVSLCTIPFFNKDGLPYGAFVFERQQQQPFTPEEMRVCEAAAALCGPVIYEKKQNDMPLHKKCMARWKKGVVQITGPGRVMSTLMALCTAVIVLLFCFAKGNYQIGADMSLEGTVQRVVISPFDGFLDDALARAGDMVIKDQVLARLDSREQLLERIRWNSQRQQHLFEQHKAIADNKVADARIIKEQIEQANVQISLLDDQIARADIRAPFDGFIIRGDLSQTIGIPLERGQELFEIAPLNSYRVILEVDEKDIDQIHTDQKGRFIVNALPENSFSFVVQKITPVSTIKNGTNVFRVEGFLEQNQQRLRPGMQGYAKISIDERKLLWIWSHELVNLVRMWLWSVVP